MGLAVWMIKQVIEEALSTKKLFRKSILLRNNFFEE